MISCWSGKIVIKINVLNNYKIQLQIFYKFSMFLSELTFLELQLPEIRLDDL